MIGQFLAKGFVLKMNPLFFRSILEGLMLISGLALLWMAVIHR